MSNNSESGLGARIVVGVLAFAVVASTITEPKRVYDYFFNRSIPASPMSIANYHEYHPFRISYAYGLNDGYSFWTDYRAQKRELDQELAYCAGKPDHCPPTIDAFSGMIASVKQIPDRLTQAKAVNAFINTFVEYDIQESENKKPHRTMVHALMDHQGVCDEQAELKLAALEILRFPQEDIREIILDVTADGKEQETGHAFVEVRINGANWILNDQDSDEPISYPYSEFNFKSALERDFVSLHGAYGKNKETQLFPLYSFNSTMLAKYDGDITRPENEAANPSKPGSTDSYTDLKSSLHDPYITKVVVLAFSMRNVDLKVERRMVAIPDQYSTQPITPTRQFPPIIRYKHKKVI